MIAKSKFNSIARLIKVSTLVLLGLVGLLLVIFHRDLFWFYDLKSGLDDFHKGRLDCAETKFKSALGFAEGYRSGDERLHMTLLALAELYMSQAKFSQAEPLIKRALAVARQLYGEDGRKTISTLFVYGGFYRRQGKFAQAMPIYNHCISVLEKSDSQSAELADLFFAVARLHMFLGDYDKAKQFYERSYAIRKSRTDGENLAVVPIICGLGDIEEANGHYQSAERLYNKAFSLANATGTKMDVGASLVSLSNLKLAEGKLDEAFDLANRALACFDAYGLKFLKASDLTSTANKAIVLIKKDQLAEAEIQVNCANSLARETLGPDHPAASTAFSVTSRLMQKKGLGLKAIETELKATAILEKAFGHRNRFVAHELGNLAEIYRQEKDFDKSEKTYKEAFVIESQVMPPKHPERAFLLSGYSKLLGATDRDDEAKSADIEAQTIMSQAMKL